MTYVDGFVAPVSPEKRDAYRAMAEMAAGVFIDHGALQVVENFSDDVPHGKQTDFYRSVDAAEGEVVAFSWVVWPSKDVRDAGMKKVMEDPRMTAEREMPFDGKRMIYGGFATIVDVKA